MTSLKSTRNVQSGLLIFFRFNLARNLLPRVPYAPHDRTSAHDAPLAHTTPRPMGPHVVLLTFSRSPKEFREILMNATELAKCRRNLETHGCAVELPSGAKIFVNVEVYGAVMEALHLSGFSLCRKNVIVSPSLKNTVVGLVRSLRSSLSVQPRGDGVLPLGLASDIAASMLPLPLEYKSTFIQIRVPNSLASSSDDGWNARSAPSRLLKPR